MAAIIDEPMNIPASWSSAAIWPSDLVDDPGEEVSTDIPVAGHPRNSAAIAIRERANDGPGPGEDLKSDKTVASDRQVTRLRARNG